MYTIESDLEHLTPKKTLAKVIIISLTLAKKLNTIRPLRSGTFLMNLFSYNIKQKTFRLLLLCSALKRPKLTLYIGSNLILTSQILGQLFLWQG